MRCIAASASEVVAHRRKGSLRRHHALIAFGIGAPDYAGGGVKPPLAVTASSGRSRPRQVLPMGSWVGDPISSNSLLLIAGSY
jgi:hypothetical protein